MAVLSTKHVVVRIIRAKHGNEGIAYKQACGNQNLAVGLWSLWLRFHWMLKIHRQTGIKNKHTARNVFIAGTKCTTYGHILLHLCVPGASSSVNRVDESATPAQVTIVQTAQSYVCSTFTLYPAAITSIGKDGS